ncbi:MAG: hypothetical protein HKP61_12135 [Dactylosporangium sp.]|nr:FIST C-terminal domain-containing protein [Dactylosporangium sp.]NNJ61670.1 hypothetical protein [Dactylosporangium sp.]
MIRTSDSRWFSVGFSISPDSRRAGEEAVHQALRATDAKVIMVFCSDTHDPRAILAGVNAVSGGVPLIGATTSGEITHEATHDRSVVVTAIGGPGIEATTAVATGVTGRQHDAGAELARCVDAVSPEHHRVLVLMPDDLAMGHRDLLDGAYSVLGPGVPLVGGCANDGPRAHRTRQLHGDEVFGDAVAAVALGSLTPFGIGVEPGWRQVGEPMLVTETAGYDVLRLDNEPALDLYLHRLGAPAPAHDDPEAFARFASAHPLGLTRRGGGPEMRCVLSADFDRRGLVSTAAVPHGAMVWFTEGGQDTIIAATELACASAVRALGDRRPIGLIAFDCMSRKDVLGPEGTAHEVGIIAEHAAGAPVSGFYAHGESAGAGGIDDHRDQTLVVLAMS